MPRFRKRPQGGYWDFSQRRVVSFDFVSDTMREIALQRRDRVEEIENDLPMFDTYEDALDFGVEEEAAEGRSDDT